MKYVLAIFSLVLSIRMSAIEFKILNDLKEKVIVTFDVYSNKGDFIPYSIQRQAYNINPGKIEKIRPILKDDQGHVFGVNQIYVTGNKSKVGSTYYIDEENRDKNFEMKLINGQTLKLTATGPVPGAMGPVFESIKVIK